MFGIGTTEILIVLVIALLLLGPKEIPKIARTIGRGMRELERAKDELKQTIEFEDDKEETPDKKPDKEEAKDQDQTPPDDLSNLPSSRI